MTNENYFNVITKVIGKEELIFQFTNFSCWIYRVNKRANFWRKAIGYFTFHSEAEKTEKFTTFCINAFQRQKDKEERRQQRLAEQKKKREELAASIKVWDLFKRSWGYDMTFNDFYQVTNIKGKKIYVRPIASEVTEWYKGYSWEEKAVKDSFIGEEQGYILSPYGWIKVCDYDHAYKAERDRSYYFNRED